MSLISEAKPIYRKWAFTRTNTYFHSSKQVHSQSATIAFCIGLLQRQQQFFSCDELNALDSKNGWNAKEISSEVSRQCVKYKLFIHYYHFSLCVLCRCAVDARVRRLLFPLHCLHFHHRINELMVIELHIWLAAVNTLTLSLCRRTHTHTNARQHFANHLLDFSIK